MTCFPWPKESISKLEGLLHAFFWKGKSTVKGGQCLVAWDGVILPRSSGGLGVRDLAAHNQAMLCKFVAKVLHTSSIPCYQWFASQYCKENPSYGSNSREMTFWKGFKPYVPMISFASRCVVGVGSLVSF